MFGTGSGRMPRRWLLQREQEGEGEGARINNANNKGNRKESRRRRALYLGISTSTRAARLLLLMAMLLASSKKVAGFSACTTGGLGGGRAVCHRNWKTVEGRRSSRLVGATVRARSRRMVATEDSMPSLSNSLPQQPSSHPAAEAAAAAAAVAATAATPDCSRTFSVGTAVPGIEDGADGAQVGAVEDQRAQRMQVAMFFFFWYTFNIGYNLTTKFTLNALPLPIMLAAIQLLVGLPYAWTLWLTGMREVPAFSTSKLRRATPVAAAHTMAHLAAVVSIGAGAVGFVQVVKGAEPLFTSGLSFLTGSAMPWPVYLTLLPVIGGVAMASAGEISFSVLAFGAAMVSNASAASRSVLGKMYMAKEKEDGGSIDAGNLYAVMTMLGCLVLTPLALIIEGRKVPGVWNAALSAGHHPHKLVRNIVFSGLFFYLYNEVSFYALKIIHPVTHALGNTLKRVVMIIVSVLVLNHKFTPLGLAGCTTAICGVMAYSMTKAKLEAGGKGEGKGGEEAMSPAKP